MPSTFNLRVYWDTCIFIAWLKDEKRKNLEMDGVAECVENALRGETLIVTGSHTNIELMPTALPPEQKARLEKLFKRRCLQRLPDDPKVSEIAEEIRTYYRVLADGKGVVDSFDALHLASAIHYRVDALYTFDEGKRGGRNLLLMDGDVAGHKLHICKPPVIQGRLQFTGP
jgi:predicted nucleic acid-binding protein